MGNGTLLEIFGGDRDDIMAEIVSALGKPPEKWWKAWQKQHEFFNEDGTWLDEDVIDANNWFQDAVWRPLKHRVTRNTVRDGVPLADDERDALVAMLEGMLKYDPEERCTIEDVMRSEWMKKYGLPAIEAEAEKKRLEQASSAKEPQDSSATLLPLCADLKISSKDTCGTTKVEQLIDTSSHDIPTDTFHDHPTAPPSELQTISIKATAAPSATIQSPQETPTNSNLKPTSDPSKVYQPADTTTTDSTVALTDEVNHEDNGDDSLPHSEAPSDRKSSNDGTENLEYEHAPTIPTDSITK